MSGYTEDHLAIALSAPNHMSGQFLASPVIPDGTGELMANCVYSSKLQEFGLLVKVEALVFDTTGSNTGRWKGSVNRFEKMFNRVLFWLAFRHHISEWFIKQANLAVRGPTKEPEDSLFEDFKENFTLSI